MAANGSFTRSILAKQLEKSLRVAIAAREAAPAGKRETKTRAAKRIATKLLNARIQLLRSRIAESQPIGLPDGGARTKIAKLESGGVEAILAEFGKST
jgi:hypothetical protein